MKMISHKFNAQNLCNRMKVFGSLSQSLQIALSVKLEICSADLTEV